MKQQSITCPQCGMTSHNPNDVEYRYCGNCKEYHEQIDARADIKAKELYGPKALAKRTGYGAPEIAIQTHIGPLALGWGETWEEAFTLAALRAKWTLPEELHELHIKFLADQHDEDGDA